MLFLGCGDLKNAFTTASDINPNQYLHIHINDNNLLIMARDILILKIVTSLEYDTSKEADVDYVWHLWYDATWPQSTHKRFMKDVQDLLSQPLPHNIFIPESSIYLERLKVIWTEWLSFAMISPQAVRADRYYINVTKLSVLHFNNSSFYVI